MKYLIFFVENYTEANKNLLTTFFSSSTKDRCHLKQSTNRRKNTHYHIYCHKRHLLFGISKWFVSMVLLAFEYVRCIQYAFNIIHHIGTCKVYLCDIVQQCRKVLFTYPFFMACNKINLIKMSNIECDTYNKNCR